MKTAREWLQAYPADREILVIAHSAEAGADLHLNVVSAGGSWFGIRRFTLNVLASRLAQRALAGSGAAPASALSFTAVVARAIHRLHAERKLTYFEPVAGRPGFPVAVARTLEELRMNEVGADRGPQAGSPLGVVDELAGLARGGKDLAAIARLVERELKEAKLSDKAALYRAAIDAIGSEENAAYVGLPLLMLDIGLRTRLEARFVRELAGLSADVLATVPEGDEGTVAALEEALGCERLGDGEKGRWGEGERGRRGERVVVKEGAPTEGLPGGDDDADDCGVMSGSSLGKAKGYLFEEGAPAYAALDGSLRVNSWPGEPRECVEIVRSIQAEAARGVAFDQMAVLLNSPGEYRSHLEEAFSRADIPAYFVQGLTAPDPAGRAMLALLLCAAEGLSARAFAEYLSLGQVPDEGASKDIDEHWVGPRDELVASATEVEGPPATAGGSDMLAEEGDVVEGSLRAPARWERLLVDSAVIGGKDRWARRLEGLANELLLRIEEMEPEEEGRVQSIKRQLRDLDALKKYALPLIERLADLPSKANWGAWLVHLRDLAVNALRAPEGVLATLADLEPMSTVGPVDLNEVQIVLGRRLHDLGVKPPPRRYGAVYVGSVDSARGLSFQIVFVPGLAERIFPRKIVGDPILPDEQRAHTSGLATRRDRLELERLALRIALGSARERAYLSYPRIDVQQSRPRVPSFYALEALRAAEGVLPGFEEIAKRAESTTRARLGWPAPERPESAIDEAEYDLALLASLVEAKDEDATGGAHYLLTANSHLARALRARSRRWLRRWTQNDGLVDADELAWASLAKHQFSARSFSATALQNYAGCPYRFFLSAVLRLQLRQEPAAIEAIDPLTRGSLFHEVQFEVLTRMKREGLLPIFVGASLRGRPIESSLEGDEEDQEGRPRSGAPTVGGTMKEKEGRPRRDAPTVVTSATELDRAFRIVDEVLDRVAGEYEDRLAPAIPRVWLDGISSVRADLREWLRRTAESDDGWVPDKFELSFGLTDRGPRDSDPDSVKDPVNIIGDLNLRGSIDLVEHHPDMKYRVTDHKTGKARAGKNTVVGGGKYLQPLLYALAAQKLLDQKVESGRLYYCTADGGYEERVVDFDKENIEILNTVLIAIRQGLVDAFLPAAPAKDECAWCDYLAVCGSFEEVRTRNKPGDRLVQLKGIRELP